MYDMVCTKLDLAHTIGQVCKFMSKLGTISHGIMFDSQQNDLSIVGYMDSNYVNNLDDKRFATRAYLLEFNNSVMSITKAEYMVVAEVYHVRTKHINVRFHKIGKLIAFGQILLQKICTSNNIVDMLTKSITINKFKHYLH
ncbi:hypothetical protein CR513_33270, partial [Mucuna pruriens]